MYVFKDCDWDPQTNFRHGTGTAVTVIGCHFVTVWPHLITLTDLTDLWE